MPYTYGFIIQDGEIWYRKKDGTPSHKYARSKVALMHCGFREGHIPSYFRVIGGKPVTHNAILIECEYKFEYFHEVIFKDGRYPVKIPARYKNDYLLRRQHGDIFAGMISEGVSIEEADKAMLVAAKMLPKEARPAIETTPLTAAKALINEYWGRNY